jgi:hypothetical protein
MGQISRDTYKLAGNTNKLRIKLIRRRKAIGTHVFEVTSILGAKKYLHWDSKSNLTAIASPAFKYTKIEWRT